ncbi:nuclear protein [Grosmannia clavigera kw1407]|uniref:Nuclear protein n=1 Tax=Grosmannia clavigera (strain kw1407 / UAMH 11150) TaxID=655863 RepID=F0XNH4_GROCL|nr:nuclear protein [Grosmannia clavigera kw1407]EFX00945.1 nuclear protein [Grosmannia clavigera kw1407]
MAARASQRSKGPLLSDGLLRQLGLNSIEFQRKGSRNRTGSQGGSKSEERKWQQQRQKAAPGTKPQKQLSARIGSGRTVNTTTKTQAPARTSKEESESDGSNEFDGFGTDGEGSEENDDTDDTTTAAEPSVSGRVREKLQKDEAEIAELERKLGIKGRKNLPQSFKEDGLGDLMKSLDSEDEEKDEMSDKRKRKAEADEWLLSKRRKALLAADKGGSEEGEDTDGRQTSDEGGSLYDLGDSTDEEGDEQEKHSDRQSKPESPKRTRENPYVAPVVAASSGKYVPPALRQQQKALGDDSETLSRVRRQAHHLVARLSDANMLTILGDIEKLYLDYPRQFVTDAVIEKLLEQVAIEGALSNSVIILIAGVATAIYQVKGVDFGAHFIQQSATLFRQNYMASGQDAATGETRAQHHSWAPTSKVLLNLLGLIAELYNFRMIGPNLIYDYVRMLLDNFTETNTELLLRIFETSGHRLRQDDPQALKQIVALIRPAVVLAGGEKNLSVRAQHMIQKIHEVKKSDKKKSRDADSSGFAYAERIRKLLGNLASSRKLEATGSLRVGLSDIEQADKRGKWWLVGASWAGHEALPAGTGGEFGGDGQGDSKKQSVGDGQQDTAVGVAQRKAARGDDNDDVVGSWGDAIPDVEELEQLAREQGMNTNARRSIFVTLLSAADSKDAHARLLRLSLNKYDKREIANVLIRCVGSEQHYNRYYALVARQVCSTDHRMAWVLQVSLWKLFRRLGEPMFGELADEEDADEEDEATDLRRIVNTAKMYGYLIATGCLGLDILKCLQLMRLQAKTRMLVEVLLITLFEEVRNAAKASGGGSGGSNTIRKRFEVIRQNEDLRRGLAYFFKHVVRKSKLVPAGQASSIAKACDRAQKALDGDISRAD